MWSDAGKGGRENGGVVNGLVAALVQMTTALDGSGRQSVGWSDGGGHAHDACSFSALRAEVGR